MIYFDAAATTLQKPPQVYQAVLRTMRQCASPGRGAYPAARSADEILYRCRDLAGKLFDTSPEQVIFTFNATHGLNIAIRSLVRWGERVIVSGYEHNAVMRPLRALGARIDCVSTALYDDEAFLRELQQALERPCAAVILTHVSNVFGWRLPVEQAAQLCRQAGRPLILDAAQSAGILPVSLAATNAAFIAMPGHKGLYGPQGTGLLLCGMPGSPLLYGGTGSQSRSMHMPEDLPDRHEAGTPNVAGIAGLAAGLEFVQSIGTERILSHEMELRQDAAAVLSRYPGLRIYASQINARQTGVLSVQWNQDCENLAEKLANAGICVRAGLHCAPLAHRSAGTIDGGTLRFSFSWFNRKTELRVLDQALEKILRQ